jgi:hypothetical protein
MIPLFAVILIGIVSAFIVLPNGYLLEKDEMAGINNEVIATYMVNSLNIESYKLMENKIIVYYNITYIEPTEYFNGETNETETRYKVFTQPKPFIINIALWNECINLTTEAVCVDLLVNNPTPLVYEVTEDIGDDEPMVYNRTVVSTRYLAEQEQLRQYYRSLKIRDNAIDNELDYLFENIG